MLSGDRRALLATWSLAEVGRQAVLAVEADTLEAFAEALCQPELDL